MTFSTVNFGQMLLATFALSVISVNAGRIAGKPAHHDLGDAIETKVSNVAPFRNPTEKYKYDYLPWPCASHGHVEGGMGGFLIGERLRASSYQVYFLSQTEKQSLCGVKTLTVEQTTKFINAIKNEFEYEMWIDDLPVFGRVGFSQTYPKDRFSDDGTKVSDYFLITHRNFQITYHKDKITSVKVSTELYPDQYVQLQPGTENKVHFTYGVSWAEGTEGTASNMPKNLRKYQIEAHWLWVLNSALLVILLLGLFSTILVRTLRNDVSRYLQIEDIEAEEFGELDDSGWKRVGFDVFRAPAHPYIFSSIVGIGAQLLMISLFLLILALVGVAYAGNHGSMYLAAIILYSFTAYVAGYVASAKLKEIDGDNHDWMKSCCLTATMFAGPFMAVFCVVNTVAAHQQSSMALPFAKIVVILLSWACITLPLTAFGAFRATNVQIKAYPFPVKKIHRELPSNLPWYHNRFLLTIMSGFIPFMSIYVEMHTIFMSIWGHQPYNLFGILLLTFFILLIVTSFIVILICYFQLNAQDYRWWWRSMLRASACGMFLFAYAVYYWVARSQMNGLLQFVLYFGYTLMLSYAFGLMLAAVGHWSSRWFVVKIFSAIHAE